MTDYIKAAKQTVQVSKITVNVVRELGQIYNRKMKSRFNHTTTEMDVDYHDCGEYSIKNGLSPRKYFPSAKQAAAFIVEKIELLDEYS